MQNATISSWHGHEAPPCKQNNYAFSRLNAPCVLFVVGAQVHLALPDLWPRQVSICAVPRLESLPAVSAKPIPPQQPPRMHTTSQPASLLLCCGYLVCLSILTPHTHTLPPAVLQGGAGQQHQDLCEEGVRRISGVSGFFGLMPLCVVRLLGLVVGLCMQSQVLWVAGPLGAVLRAVCLHSDCL